MRFGTSHHISIALLWRFYQDGWVGDLQGASGLVAQVFTKLMRDVTQGSDILSEVSSSPPAASMSQSSPSPRLVASPSERYLSSTASCLSLKVQRNLDHLPPMPWILKTYLLELFLILNVCTFLSTMTSLYSVRAIHFPCSLAFLRGGRSSKMGQSPVVLTVLVNPLNLLLLLGLDHLLKSLFLSTSRSPCSNAHKKTVLPRS
jgi:hypothetical protein